ncbi:MAG: hypothetical protein L3J28_00055 [Candidatus Polarisedimenticolaceae bacterium]|nr:hypothetical protein [Candidatus Polarisedimenticolaceae bacterium]
MKTYSKRVVALLCIVTLLFITACSQNSDSPEDQIKAYIAAGEAATQARDTFAMKSLIAKDYRDERNRKQQNIVALVAGYFLRHKNIHTLTRIKKLTFSQPDQADLVLLAGLAGDPIEGFEHLLALRATIHLFEMKLVRYEGEWLLQSVRWRRAKREDWLAD